MRRRVLLTGESTTALCTTAPPAGLVTTSFGAALAATGVGVELALAAPSATRAAGVVAEGTSFTPVGALMFAVSAPGRIVAARPSGTDAATTVSVFEGERWVRSHGRVEFFALSTP